MDATAVQEFNGETGTWDTLPPDQTPGETTTAPVVEIDDDAPAAAAKVEATPAPKVETPADPWASRRPTNAEARKDPKARIAQQTWDQRDAERRAADAEKKAAALEQRLAALEKPAPAKVDPPVTRTAPANDPEPDHTDATKYPGGEYDPKFLKEQARWEARQEIRAEQQKAAAAATEQRLEQEFSTQARAFSETYAKAITADPALEARVNADLLSVRPYSKLTAADKAVIQGLPPAQRERVAFQCFLADQWLGSEHPVAMLEYLSDPQTFQRLATLPPGAVIRDLAKYEAGLTAASPTTTGSAAKPPAKSATPPPIQPVGSSPHVPNDDPSDDDDDETWRKKEDARVLRMRRRG